MRQKYNKHKYCRICNVELRLGENWLESSMKINQYMCKACHNENEKQRVYKKGLRRPMGENKECPMYLGVHISEKYLAQIFENVEKMPNGHPGFDFICSRDYKIDVKSSCRRKTNLNDFWAFNIRQNRIADYFLCLAFNNRESLKPEHLWLIPAEKVNHLTSLSIRDSKKPLLKWSEYELDSKLDKFQKYCLTVKNNHE